MKMFTTMSARFIAGIIFLLVPCIASADSNAISQQGQTTQQSQTVITGSSDGDSAVRPFANPGSISLPGTASYWGTITQDGLFQPISEITQFRDGWFRYQADWIASQETGKVKGGLQYERDEKSTNSLIVVLSIPPKELAKFNAHYELITPDTFRAEDRATSSKVFGTAALAGMNTGANVMLLLNEGFSLRLDAESLGIGIAPQISVSSSPGGAGAGGIAGGGLGWVHAWAEYYSRPWIRVAFFRKVKEGYPLKEATWSYHKPSTEEPTGEIYKPKKELSPKLEAGGRQ